MSNLNPKSPAWARYYANHPEIAENWAETLGREPSCICSDCDPDGKIRTLNTFKRVTPKERVMSNETRENAQTSIDEAALTAAHLAVEDVLIDMRDSRMGVLGRANGFIVNEKDGTPSSIMRLGTRDGLRIGIEAYLNALANQEGAI